MGGLPWRWGNISHTRLVRTAGGRSKLAGWNIPNHIARNLPYLQERGVVVVVVIRGWVVLMWLIWEGVLWWCGLYERVCCVVLGLWWEGVLCCIGIMMRGWTEINHIALLGIFHAYRKGGGGWCIVLRWWLCCDEVVVMKGCIKVAYMRWGVLRWWWEDMLMIATITHLRIYKHIWPKPPTPLLWSAMVPPIVGVRKRERGDESVRIKSVM